MYQQQGDELILQITPKGEDKSRRMQKFNVSIRISNDLGWIEDVKFVIWNYGDFKLRYKKDEEEKKYSRFESEIELPQRALYHVFIEYTANGKKKFYKKTNKTGDENISKEECWKLAAMFKAPEWAKGAVMYQIFIDRFKRSKENILEEMQNRKVHEKWNEPPILGEDPQTGLWNIDFYGGDLKGVIEALDYISSLGVNVIYFTPIWESRSNHRYNTDDYKKVDSYAGTNEQVMELTKEAKKRGIHIMMDAVFNHTGNTEKYVEFHIPGECWWNDPNLPKCNPHLKEWQDYIYGKGGVIDYWYSLGIDSLRYDVADELEDFFIEGCNEAAIRNNEDTLLLAEVWNDPTLREAFILKGRGFHSAMNYQLEDALISYFKENDVEKLKGRAKNMLINYPTDTLLTAMNFSSTHDISRIIDVYGYDDEFKTKEERMPWEWIWDLKNQDSRLVYHHLSKERYEFSKMLVQAHLFTLTFWPGIVSIFYGDEVGIQGLGNLATRAPFPWDNMDYELLEFVRNTVGGSRKKYTFLKTAETEVLDIDSDYFMFERYDENNRAVIVVSRKNGEQKVPISYENAEVMASLRCTNEVLGPYGAIAVLEK